MGSAHLSVTPTSVYTEVQRAVSKVFTWPDYKTCVTGSQIIDLLIYMATTARSLSSAVRRRFSFCPESGRRAIHKQMPPAAILTAGLATALHSVLALSRLDRRRRWTVAIDTHSIPFYGSRKTPGITGGAKKQGTHYFFGYATAVLLHRRRRYTVGLIDAAGMKPHDVVVALFQQLDAHQLLVKGVVLDSGFESGETILWLQARKLDFVLPLRRRGAGSNRRNDCFAWAHGTINTVDWVTDVSRKAVSVRVLVWKLAAKKNAKTKAEKKEAEKKKSRAKPGAKQEVKNKGKQKGKKEVKKEVEDRMRIFAFSGWGDVKAVKECRRAWLARRRYRERFAIETSYRQKNAMRGWTTSCSARYRLLLEGIAHLLRQVWVILTEIIARARKLKPTDWIADFTGHDLTDWLRERLEFLYPAEYGIPLAGNELK